MSRQLDEEAIFQTARLIENPEARRQYLNQICTADQPLRARVEALLNVNEQDQQFLKSAPRPEPTVDFQGDDSAKSLLLTRDGKRLVTGGLWDGRIRVWKLQ